jgi:hypothetical protein
MANKLDERLDHLRFDINAMIDFEKASGMSVVKLDLDKLSKDLSLHRALLWAMLRNLDPKEYPDASKITIEEAGRMITLRTLEPVAKKMVVAIMDGLPLPDQGAEAGKKKR